MSSFIDKLKTQLGGYFAKEEDLAPIATTGDYNDLINAPQGGGGGNDNIIKVVVSNEDIDSAAPSDYVEAVQTGNVGKFTTFALAGTGSYMYTVGYEFSEDSSTVIFYFNNLLQNSRSVGLVFFAEYNNHFHSFQIGNSFEISSEQKTYYIGSLEPKEEPEPNPGEGPK